MLYTVLHYGNKEEKLSAFLDTGQRNKGEEQGEENYQNKRNKERKKQNSFCKEDKSKLCRKLNIYCC